MMIDFYGMPLGNVPDIEDMTYPMQCKRCGHVHDGAKVKVIDRYTDCSTWRCPDCKSLIDDRPESWGGSAIPVKRWPKP